MDEFELKKILVNKNIVTYEYNFNGKWCDLLTSDKFFSLTIFLKFSNIAGDLEDVQPVP